MRFDNPSEEDDVPIRPKSILPTPDRTSNVIRIRLFMLFGLLIFVIILMKEAGNPERWQWMGFEEARDVEFNPDDPVSLSVKSDPMSNPSDLATGNSSAERPAQNLMTPSVTILVENAMGAPTQKSQPPIIPLNSQTTDFPLAAIEFWETTFRKLGTRQQEELLRTLKRMRHSQVVPAEERESVQTLVRLIKGQRAKFQQQMFDRLALAPDGTTAKTRLADEMYESQDIWEKQVYPALTAASQGNDFSVVQQQAIIRLQKVLDPILFEMVQDKSSIGWTGDSAAWKRIWEFVTAGEPADPQPATFIQLMSQPEIYRGQPVTVEGWIRSAKQKMLSEQSELGLAHYYILWVRPKETKLGPFCIYARSLPADFPQVTEVFSDVNVHVRITGYSFKVRTYVAADNSVKHCPVVVASLLEPIVTTSFTAVNQWQPSRSTIVIALILIPLIATGFAWLVFRGSRTRQFSPGKTMKKRIDDTLSELADDPNVQTDREKVLSLQETESQND